jgi:phage-related protein
MFGDLARFFADLLDRHPQLQELVFTLGGMLTIMKLIAATGITTFLTSAISSMILLTTATEGATVSSLGLNAALRANPVGLVVTALQALGVALYIAYTQSEDFRNVVNALGSVLLEVWDFLNRFHGVLLLLVPVIGPTIFAFKNMHEIIGALKTVIDAAVTAFETMVNVVGIVSEKFNDALTFIRNFRDNFRNAAQNAGEAIYNGIKAGITGLVTEVETILNRIVKELRDRISAWTTAGRNLGRAIYNGIVNAVDDTVGRVRTIITNVINAVTGLIGRARTAATNMGNAIFNGIRNALANIAGVVRGLILGAVNAAIRLVNDAIGRINSTLDFQITAFGRVIWEGGAPDIPLIPRLMAEGGIVTGPTLAMMGEKGPEAVIPLPDRADLLNGGSGITVNVAGSIIQERDLARTIRDAVGQATRRDSGFMGGGLAAVPR